MSDRSRLMQLLRDFGIPFLQAGDETVQTIEISEHTLIPHSYPDGGTSDWLFDNDGKFLAYFVN